MGSELNVIGVACLAIIPLFFLCSALWVYCRKDPSTFSHALRVIAWACSGLLTLSLGMLVWVLLGMSPSESGLSLLNTSPLQLIVLSLILFIATVLIHFSRNYMRGEVCLQRYCVWILLTLAAVTLTVVSNHLLLFWLGWVSISLCLHHLLTLYPERSRAVLAAHKKFILARIAETLLLIAFVLLYWEHHTFYIHPLLQAITESTQGLSWQEQVAATLIAIAALIKCAQLPVHGWLIKVVEAPTPVSALLHAGVINLGGFVLILFAPLFSQALVAQWLVLIVAGLSTLLAALIMTTRISIKVRLAWSTSAQMGMMLIECALGLYELALLHLVLHSLYKAYSFLNAGNAVNDSIRQRMTPFSSLNISFLLVSGLWVGGCISAAVVLTHYQGPLAVWILLGLALTSLMVSHSKGDGMLGLLRTTLVVTILAGAYALLKWVFGQGLGLSNNYAVAAFSAADIWASLLFLALFILSLVLTHYAHLPRIQQLSTLLFAGFYLDEWFTRTTLSIWPTTLPAGIKGNGGNHQAPYAGTLVPPASDHSLPTASNVTSNTEKSS